MDIEKYRLTEDDIDSIRMKTVTDIGASHTWWDICAAYEKMHGMDSVIATEQLLIDITNRTTLKALDAQLAKLQPAIDEAKRVNHQLAKELSDVVLENKELRDECEGCIARHVLAIDEAVKAERERILAIIEQGCFEKVSEANIKSYEIYLTEPEWQSLKEGKE
jgi:hypothetical protein